MIMIFDIKLFFNGISLNIANIGIIRFLLKDLLTNFKKDKNSILHISINFNYKENSSLDIMIKATPIL